MRRLWLGMVFAVMACAQKQDYYEFTPQSQLAPATISESHFVDTHASKRDVASVVRIYQINGQPVQPPSLGTQPRAFQLNPGVTVIDLLAGQHYQFQFNVINGEAYRFIGRWQGQQYFLQLIDRGGRVLAQRVIGSAPRH